VEIRKGGVLKTRLVTAVADSVLAVFTEDGGAGQAAATNEDGTANSLGNPALRGSIVTIFATGEGQTSPAGISLTMGGEPATILLACGVRGYEVSCKSMLAFRRESALESRPFNLRPGPQRARWE
jgi:uncharacterized protein (TIGR03437 family)